MFKYILSSLAAVFILTGIALSLLQPDRGFHLSYKPHLDTSEVFVAGEFSDWQLLPMGREDDGVWRTCLDLEPGEYGYKFVVCGTAWVVDPDATSLKTIGEVRNSAFTIPEQAGIFSRVQDFFTLRKLEHEPTRFNDDVGYRESLMHEVAFLFRADHFDVLEAIALKWRVEDPHTISGIPQQLILYESLAINVGGELDEAFFHDLFARLDRWRAAYPSSSVEPIARAYAYQSLAWASRGDGWASEVTAEGWGGFRDGLQSALDTLELAPSESQADMVWHLLKYRCDGMVNDRDAAWEAVNDAIERYGFDSLAIDFAHAWFSLPRWGGDRGEWQAFARSYSNAGDPERFARIVWSLYGSFGNRMRIFSRQDIGWTELQEGFEAMMLHYPDSYRNLNQYGYFACMAGDKESARRLITQIEEGAGHMCDIWALQYNEWKAWAFEDGERPVIPAAKGYEAL